jgi:hypothetical protein
MRRFLMVLALTGCSKSAEVKCGSGTVLRNGACEVAIVGSAIAAASTAPVAIDAKLVAVDPWNVDAGVMPVETWNYEDNKDEMRGLTTNAAIIRSVNATDFHAPYGVGYLRIIVRHGPPGSKNPGDDVILASDGAQFECQSEGCGVAMKFDDGKVENYWAEEAASNTKGLLLERGQLERFLTSTRKAKKLMVEARFYGEGPKQFTFNVDGFKWERGPKPATPMKWCFSFTPSGAAGVAQFGDRTRRTECVDDQPGCESRITEIENTGALGDHTGCSAVAKTAPAKRWCFVYTPKPPEGQYVSDDKSECFATSAACEARRDEILKTPTAGTVVSCEAK